MRSKRIDSTGVPVIMPARAVIVTDVVATLDEKPM